MKRTLAVLCALGLVACGSSGPTPLKRSPEPAKAPVAADPAGQVVTLAADDPEGAVVTAAGLVVVAARRPAALLVLRESLAPVRQLDLAGAARHLQLDGPDVVVPEEQADAVAVIDPATGKVLSTAAVGDNPHDATVADGVVAETEEGGYAIGFVQDGKLVGRLKGLDFPGGIAADRDRVAAVEVRGRVLTVADVHTHRLVAKVPVGAGPTHAVSLGHGLVAVADTSGDAVFVVQVQGKPHVVSRLRLAGKPYGMAVDLSRGRLWVATGADNLLHELTLSGDRLEAGTTYPTVQQPNSLAVTASGAVVVVGATNPGRVELVPAP